MTCVPPFISHWSEKHSSRQDATISYTLNTPPDSASTHHLVKELHVTYRSVEDDGAMDLFKRLNEVLITQGGRAVHRLTSSVWSTSIVLQQKNLVKNRKESMLFIPLPTSGLIYDVKEQPIVVTFVFRVYQKEHERLGLFALYDTLHRGNQVVERAAPAKYWTWTNPIYVKMPGAGDKTTKYLDIELPWFSEGMTVGQLIFHVPGANAWIASGKLWADDPETEDSMLLYQFQDPYHAVVVDKVLFDLPLPKQPLFTLTFCNWYKEKPEAGFHVRAGKPLRLHLDLDDLPEDNRPKDASLEIYAVIGFDCNPPSSSTATFEQ